MKTMIHYLITDPTYYGDTVEKFSTTLNNTLKNHNVDMVCFRDKISQNKKELAKICIDICKKNNIKQILINGDISLAKELNATGVHLTSAQFDQIQKAKNENLYTVISCHTTDEIQKAQDLNCDAVTYSPIFNTPNKGKLVGIEKLKETVNTFTIPVIALGGIITNDQINQIKLTNSSGFASIRYFLS